MMNKITMCRICLVENVRMHEVINKNLHELYEKLTDIPFVTQDSRPILACFVCCAQLKKCYRLRTKCLEAEERFAQIINGNYEPKPLINQDHLELFYGFINSPIQNINIVDVGQNESMIVKEEVPTLEDIIEPKEEHQSDDGLEAKNIYDNYLDINIPPHYSELDSEDGVPLMKFKTEPEEEQELSENKRKAKKTNRAHVTKQPELDTRGTKQEDTITAEQNKTDPKITQNTQNRTKLRLQKSVNNTVVDTDCHSNRDFKPFKCDICHSSFTHMTYLTNHNRIHTGEKPFKCDICQHSFTQMGNLTIHIRTHTGEKPFKCHSCQRSFNRSGDLKSHVRIHTGEKPFKCDLCPSSFKDKSDLTNHSRIHTGEKPFKCDICQRSFTQKENLKSHIRTHTGEKPFKCHICQRSFIRNGGLKTHIRKHTGEKPFKCDVCQRSFRDKSDFNKHIKIHTGEKPFKCHICQRTFNRNGDLKSHVRIHTGEKPFKCDVCERSFRQRGSLTKHTTNRVCRR